MYEVELSEGFDMIQKKCKVFDDLTSFVAVLGGLLCQHGGAKVCMCYGRISAAVFFYSPAMTKSHQTKLVY